VCELSREIAPQCRPPTAPLLARTYEDQRCSFLRGDLGEPFGRVANLDPLLLGTISVTACGCCRGLLTLTRQAARAHPDENPFPLA
jgi:hypothetical protein